ncbi:putative phosphatidylglycerol/phosphatidylinositol transfer protein DDB_G0278295 [Halichondria panicea]|uniref:putative phosphatidylglycerol/phosphatidylinositol transfer protein DDB_G0278295 n=1 Tax=Halichondria panicea TaxID=6063 RepID=UPI00312B60A4
MDATKTTIVLLIVTLSVTHFVDCGVTLITPSTLASFPKDFTNCSAKGDIGKVLNFSLNSYDFRRGDTIVGNLTYFLYHDISGNVTLSAWGRHGVVPYFGDTLNLCDTKVISCPLKAGEGHAVFKYPLGQFQSIGWYEVHLVVSDENKTEVACLDFKLEIKV